MPCTRQKQPPEVFRKIGVLRNFAKFTGKHLCQSLFFNKVVGLRPATLLKRKLLEISQNSQQNTCARVSSLRKLNASVLQTYLKQVLFAMLQVFRLLQ